MSTTILLLHGVESAASTWWRVGPDLETLGFRVVAPDLPGHGGRPAVEPTVGALAEAIARDLDGPVFTAGHSLGAVVGLELAARHPDLVTGLLLEDPPALGGVIRAEDVAADVVRDSAAARGDPAAYAARLLAEHPTWARADAEHAAENAAAVDTAVAAAVLGAGWDLAALVAARPVPVRVLAAAEAETALVEPARTAVLSSCEHLVVDAGHGIHRDRPGVWVAAVAAAASGRSILGSAPGTHEG